MNLRKEAQVLVKYIRNNELKIGEVYDDFIFLRKLYISFIYF